MCNSRDPFGTCKVDVRFSKLGGSGNGWNHAYITTSAPDDTRTYFRGGPTSGGPSSGASGATGSAAGGSSGGASGSGSSGSNSANSSSPGSGGAGGSTGAWGSIKTESGAYTPGTIDYEPGDVPSLRDVENDESGDKRNRQLSATPARIKKSK